MTPLAAPAANRRSSTRRKPKASTKVQCIANPMGLGPNVAVSVLDVSETGIRLVLKSALAVGQEIEIGLEGAADRKPTKVGARVIWCAALADGNFCTGARFHKPLPYGVVQAVAYI
jgi:hypothetical protein